MKLQINQAGDYIWIKDGILDPEVKYVLFDKNGKEIYTHFNNRLVKIYLV